MSEEALRVVEGLALQRTPLSAAAIHRELLRLALTSGQTPPSYHTVRRVITQIPPALMTLGREGEKAYRDTYDLVQRREVHAPNEMWQADHTQLDLVALRVDGKEGRPWLTIITDATTAARLLQQVAAHLKIRLVYSTPGVPRGRGKIERFFRSSITS